MPGSWREICPLAARFRYYDLPRFIANERMAKPKSFLRVFTEPGPLVALAVAVALLVGIAGPASAQFFNFGNFGGPQRPQPRSGGGGGWFGSDFFAPFQQQQAPKKVIREDFSKAPPPEKR